MHTERVIGFDLRIPRTPENPWHKDYLIRNDLEAIVSIDPFVFPIPITEDDRRSNEASEPRMNFRGLLMDLPVAQPYEWVIAIATEDSVAQAQEIESGQRFISSSLYSTSVLRNEGWRNLGYDVADLNILISGLMNCGPCRADVRERFLSSINEYGLFADRHVARTFADIVDIEIPSHSPFIPVSIWLAPHV